ncbi:MAG: hypothetical protein IKI62_01990 [Clostridia bacterium]|nr:hypothetical protein [Clostridia bacterium]
MIYSETLKPRLSDIDFRGHIAPEAILKILEDIGTHHSDSEGDLIISREEGDLAWILAEWHVSYRRLLLKREKITVDTWISGRPDSLYFFRNFLVKDEDGNEILRAQTKIVLVDIKTMNMLRITDEIYKMFSPEEYSAFDSLPRIKARKEYDSEVALAIRSDDLDFNDHVHNTRYLGLALDALGKDRLKDLDIKNIRYICRNAVTSGEEVFMRYTDEGSSIYLEFYGHEKPYMVMEIETF